MGEYALKGSSSPSLAIHLSIHLPTQHPSNHLPIHLPIHPSTHPPIHPPMHPSIHPSIHLSMYPSIHLCLQALPSPRCLLSTRVPPLHPPHHWVFPTVFKYNQESPFKQLLTFTQSAHVYFPSLLSHSQEIHERMDFLMKVPSPPHSHP